MVCGGASPERQRSTTQGQQMCQTARPESRFSKFIFTQTSSKLGSWPTTQTQTKCIHRSSKNNPKERTRNLKESPWTLKCNSHEWNNYCNTRGSSWNAPTKFPKMDLFISYIIHKSYTSWRVPGIIPRFVLIRWRDAGVCASVPGHKPLGGAHRSMRGSAPW